MKFAVWHADPPNFMADLVKARRFPDGFVHVADVDAPTIDKAFELTNHIDHSWQHNVECEARIDNPRSTSVGDVLVQGDVKMMCDVIGWVTL